MKMRKSQVLSESTPILTQSGLRNVLLRRQHEKVIELAERRAHRGQKRSAYSSALTMLLARAHEANSRSSRRVFHERGATFQEIHSYTELRQQIHDELRLQHSDWVQPNGESPICDSYEARLMELIDPLTRTGAEPKAAQ